jgi:uncharacterized protein (TIGR02452 family)
MTRFPNQISRELAARYGHETVAIGDAGYYHAPSGKRVEIAREISFSVSGSVSYPPDRSVASKNGGGYATVTLVKNETTLSAARELMDAGTNPVVLNFASATHPGGGFLNGARAQEEYLARSSCLYQCIRNNAMYEFHRARHDSMYTDYVIYSPNVPVIRNDDGDLLEEPYTVSIIISPAPNANNMPASKHHEIAPAIWSRILKVLGIGVEHRHDAIVLGAWGCGAFGNDPDVVAELFHQALHENFKGAYLQVVFAIIDWSIERRFIGPFEKRFA